MTLRQRVVFVGALLALMAASGLLGWRANITFEPNPIKYVPIRVPDRWYVNLG